MTLVCEPVRALRLKPIVVFYSFGTRQSCLLFNGNLSRLILDAKTKTWHVYVFPKLAKLLAKIPHKLPWKESHYLYLILSYLIIIFLKCLTSYQRTSFRWKLFAYLGTWAWNFAQLSLSLESSSKKKGENPATSRIWTQANQIRRWFSNTLNYSRVTT